MNGAGLIVQTLEELGVDTVFGYPGGAIMPLYDALLEARFQHVLVRHEQAAAFAADGYARSSGKVGVCLSTSGPGATNLVTGLAGAHMDSIPVLAITGQVPQGLMGTDAFQEVDVLGITLPIVKHSFLPRSLEELAWMLPEAYALAAAGRPGPVLIDLPKDLLQASWHGSKPRLLQPPATEPLDSQQEKELHRAARLLAKARRPLAYVGGGIAIAACEGALVAWLEETGIPAVTTLRGIGAVPGDHSQCLGMLGMHGSREANLAVQSCDLLIALGARFDDRATGKLAEFAPKAAVIHLDIDPAEQGKLRQAQVASCASFPSFFSTCRAVADLGPWWQELRGFARPGTSTNEAQAQHPGGLDPKRLLTALARELNQDTIVACDVGQHQMWVAQAYPFHSGRHHLSSSGLGAMGYGLPAAIGAQFAHPASRVLCVTGDGSLMMNIQELSTVKRYALPIKILLFDNQALGLVRQWQNLFFQGRISQVDLSDNPDFVAVAQSFGIPAIRLDSACQEDLAVALLRSRRGPLLIHVPVDPQASVWPLVPPGSPNHHMLEGAPS